MQEVIGNRWTEAQERAFTEIIAASRLSRVRAIHLWKRCRENAEKAIRVAKTQYPKASELVCDRLAKARMARKRANA